jgi:hypothetical protein
VAFQTATWLGYPDLLQQSLYLSIVIVAACLSLPMAIYMAVRGHGRRHNLEMTGITIGVGMAMIGLVWSGVISTSGLQTWHDVFGLVSGMPAHDRRDVDQLQHVQRTPTSTQLCSSALARA